MSLARSSSGSTSDRVIAVLAILTMGALGFLFWKGVERAKQEKKSASRISPEYLPPGARVVTGAKRPSAAPPTPRPTVKMDFSKPPPPLTAPARTAAPPAAALTPLMLETGPLVRAVSTPPSLTLPERAVEGLQVARLTALADTCIRANLGTEPERNAGAMGELPIRGNESFFLARYDVTPVKGWTIHRAIWRARVRSGRPDTLGFSAVRETWEEGSHMLADAPSRGATFRWASFNRQPWREDKPPFSYLIRGHAGGLFVVGRPLPPTSEQDPWIEVPLDPVLVQALVVGAADSLAISDEKGQLNSVFSLASREMPGEEHYIEAYGLPQDFVPPSAPGDLTVAGHSTLQHPTSLGVLLRWKAPGDDGGAGRAFCYEVRYGLAPVTFEKARPVPRHLVPWPASAGTPEQMILEGLKPNTPYVFFIRALDEAGAAGPVAEIAGRTPAGLFLPGVEKAASFDASPLEMGGGALALRVLAENDGVDPGSGIVLTGPPDAPPGAGNQSLFWDRATRTIHLKAAAGEIVGFQMCFSRLGGTFPALEVNTSPFETSQGPVPGLTLHVFETGASHYPTRRSPLAWHVDEMLPLAARRYDPQRSSLAGRRPDPAHQVLYAELKVPEDLGVGLYRGRLSLAVGDQPPVSLLVLLNVLPVSLPTRPRFTVELGVSPILARQHKGENLTSRQEALEIEYRYHQLARAHRCTLFIRPYLGQGAPAPWSCPPLTGSSTGLAVQSWAAWDAQFAPLLSGRLFAPSNLSPSAPENLQPFALSHVWLPVFESWPTPFAAGWTCPEALTVGPEGLRVFSGDAAQMDSCLSANYRQAWTRMLELFQAHVQERRWTNTAAHLWLVNVPTNTYRGLPPPWSLGQPLFRDDFLALEMFARWRPPNPASPCEFRVTVPEAAALAGYGRGLFSLLAVSDRSAAAWNLLGARAATSGETLWLQNDVMPLNETPLPTLAGVLRAFLKGADGWAIREASAPTEETGTGRPEAILRSGRTCGVDHPVPTLRLKAIRRLQQDIEYLLLLQDKRGWTRAQLADFVLSVQPEIGDPYKMTAEHLARLRLAVQELLLK